MTTDYVFYSFWPHRVRLYIVYRMCLCVFFSLATRVAASQGITCGDGARTPIRVGDVQARSDAAVQIPINVVDVDL